MDCNCPKKDCVQSTVDNVQICTCTTIIENIVCPEGCQTIILENGNAVCSCVETVPPTTISTKTLVDFDNIAYFKDVSWTISYKPTEGSWNSYFTFHPDFTPFHQEYFQVGYNWGKHKGTMWNHTFKNDSFCVFQGEYQPWVIEFPIANEGVDKILSSLSINVEAKRYTNHYDYTVHKDIGITDMFIYNQTNNTGYLVIHPQETLKNTKNYPKTVENKQHILSATEDGKQKINYFFNRVLNQDNNVPMFKKDENNIFKTIDPRAVKFGGKKILERLRGEVFIVNLSNTKDSRFGIEIKSAINNEIAYE
jgi:hypothetical protein